MPQNVIEFGPGFHGYNGAWFVRGVTSRVAIVTTERVAIRVADISVKVKVKVKVNLPPSCHGNNIRETEVQHWMDRSGRLTSLPLYLR